MSTAVQPDILHRFATRARRLYSLPAAAVRVIELARQPEMDTQALRECIETDPVLTAKILRLANSSVFGLSQQVTSLTQAFALLGSKAIRVLVLGFSLPQELLTSVECQVLSRYWRQAVIKSVAAREINEQIRRVSGEEAFLAGLLQDIGLLALAQDLGPPYVEFLKRIFDEGGNLPELERATLGFDHRELSREMLEHWGIPASVSRIVAIGPALLASEGLSRHERTTAHSLHLADRVCEFLLQGRASLLEEVLELGRQYDGPDYTQLERLMDCLQANVPQLLEVLANDPVEVLDYRNTLLEAYRLLEDAAQPSVSQASGEAALLTRMSGETRDLSEAVQHLLGRGDRIAPPTGGPSGFAAAAPVRLRPLALRSGGQVSLNGLLQSALHRCRQARCELSLLLIEIDRYASLEAGGAGAAQHLMQPLATAIRESLGDDGLLAPLSPGRLAIILEGQDRQQSVALSRQLVRAVNHWSVERAPTAVSISVGLATLAIPPKNFPVQDLVDAADRCLHAVQLSGGDGVKSIDI